METNKFSSASDVLKIVLDIERSMLPRSNDRAAINNQFNGGRPFTPQEEKDFQIQVNTNFLEGYKIAQAAILQTNTALLYKDRFFNLKALRGNPVKRREWGEKVTSLIHKPLKKKKSGKSFMFTLYNRDASLTLHGVGALWWSNNFAWQPKFVALDDLLIPTDAPLDFSDGLGNFGVNSWLTPYQLWQIYTQENQQGWNREMIQEIGKSLKGITDYSPDYWDQPEKMESLWKQRSAYLNSDAVPKVKITTFYYQSSDKGSEGKWFRKVVLRENQAVGISEDMTSNFLYESKSPFADSIDQIISVQFGDGSVVAPFKFRSVRGIGVLLYSVIELMNRLRCQFTQSVFLDYLQLLRIDNPVDRDRPRMLQMQQYGVVPDGVNFVRSEERHHPDYRLTETAMSEFRQLMSENSASYVQDIDTGSSKAMTLGEAQIRLQSVNKMVASMLMGAYEQEAFTFSEIVRRFFGKTPSDPEVVEFQASCRAAGIPDELMDAEAWDVEITRAFGAGDQTLAQQEVTSLLQMRPTLDPKSQRIVDRNYISVFTRNPELADELVPMEKSAVTSGTKAAEDLFGTLMQGVRVAVREGIEQSDYVVAMLGMMQDAISQIQASGNVGTRQDVAGLYNVANDIQAHIQILSQDPGEKQLASDASKELGKLLNEVKGFEQRLAEQEAEKQINPEQEAKIQAMQMTAQVKAESQQQMAELKLQQQQALFDQQIKQQMEKHQIDMQQMIERMRGEMMATAARIKSETESSQARLLQEVRSNQVKTDAEINQEMLKTAAEIQSKEKLTDAEVKAKEAATPAKE